MKPLVIMFLMASILVNRAHGAATPHKQSCVPMFFNRLPKDSKWFYGVGTGRLASDSRESGIHALALNAVGNSSATWAVAGFEQEDYVECDWVTYTLIRINKSQVEKNQQVSPREMQDTFIEEELRSQEDRIVSRIQSPPTAQTFQMINVVSPASQDQDVPAKKSRRGPRRISPPSTYLRALFGDQYFPKWCQANGGVIVRDGSCLLGQ